ncbi:MAG: MBL fold metallo-hydrolase [Alistipes sp.]|nr:MBL fold metallo-hydrolase [Candidatus Alistipes equi]
MFFFKKAPELSVYPSDEIVLRDGSKCELIFYHHASIAVRYNDRIIYFDPAGEQIAWEKLQKADLIIITHAHFDHFDRKAVEQLKKPSTEFICTKEVSKEFDGACITMTPYMESKPFSDITVKSVPAYNMSDGHTDFHPKQREDCGYILYIGGSSIYVAGDTEDTQEVLSLKDIDIAFLPVNQPYTMTVEQAVRVVKAIKPQIFYPYHYGEVDVVTDISRLKEELLSVTDVRIRPLE